MFDGGCCGIHRKVGVRLVSRECGFGDREEGDAVVRAYRLAIKVPETTQLRQLNVADQPILRDTFGPSFRAGGQGALVLQLKRDTKEIMG